MTPKEKALYFMKKYDWIFPKIDEIEGIKRIKFIKQNALVLINELILHNKYNEFRGYYEEVKQEIINL
jgi:hypothetical protein